MGEKKYIHNSMYINKQNLLLLVVVGLCIYPLDKMKSVHRLI